MQFKNKKEMVIYALSIGVENLEASMTKMQIMAHIQEKTKELDEQGINAKELAKSKRSEFEDTALVRSIPLGNKAKIAELQYNKLRANNGEDIILEPVAEKKEAKANKPSKEVPKDSYLVKFVGQSASYNIGSYRFSKAEPYHLVDKATFDRVMANPYFREASPEEVTAFYK